jgi:diguanylate cyclase (GGDEF)-like protein/PAS domain S-box-containing protein
MDDLRDDHARLRAAVAAAQAIAAAGDIAYDWDLVTDTVQWSGRTKSIFGDVTPPTTGSGFRALVLTEDQANRAKRLQHHLETRGSQDFDCEYRLRAPDGRFVWVDDRGAAQFHEDGRPSRLMGTLRIITARKEREARLEYIASFDELTGHYNKLRLREALQHGLALAARYRIPGAYLVVGIDKLTSLEQAFGPASADALIVGVGQRIEACLRASDIIGRLGGDRFGIVLSGCPEGSIGIAAGKILQAVRQTPIITPNGPVHATVSIGGVAFAEHGGTAPEVMGRADVALQEAKKSGRNCFVRFFESEEQREARRRAAMMSEEVQSALKTGRLILAYQPVVDARTHVVDHYECLLRLRLESGAIVAAGAFVPVVERSGLMRLIDRRALDLALAELSRHPEISLAINISAVTTSDASWLRTLNASLKNRPDIATRLCVELTETIALENIEETAKFVSALRNLGVRVALDDFGAGFTSFRNLRALAVDTVKIDGSFIKDLAGNVDNQVFVRTLMGLADSFGLSTVAECVETAADAAHLAERGVRFLQGYYFGKPSIERPWLDDESAARLPKVATLN